VAWTDLGRKAWGEDSVREAFLKTIPVGKFALPEEVADAVVFLCQVCYMIGRRGVFFGCCLIISLGRIRVV
jgi:NAD(P)-dependent dehydrogenase (short-subunit alcohol dehydrogenase family)